MSFNNFYPVGIMVLQTNTNSYRFIFQQLDHKASR
uniref:Uncharacterized protein n=1 Tax=Nelumbo nucifera TaxID=4432 RepID=A0A822ZGF1_NELNU|nr:TPA_asm: hypothetical protein HUJ06_015041 [Nelumbo nucifera]